MNHQNAQLAIVTGTSSGIGASLARRLLDTGWSVIGLSRRDVAFDHKDYHHFAVDLADNDRLTELASNALEPIITDESWERVALVNNAAIVGFSKGLEGIGAGELQRVLAVNTVAPMFLMGFVARVTPPALPLRIVNVSSGAAVRAFPGLSDYCASKAALRMAGMALAAELDSDLRPGGRRANATVFSYEPGVVDTPMQTASRTPSLKDFPWGQTFKDFAAQGLLERPEDVVGEIVDFVAGDGRETFVERRFGADP